LGVNTIDVAGHSFMTDLEGIVDLIRVARTTGR